MLFTKRLCAGVRNGEIRSRVRIWKRPRVTVGGRYVMDDGWIVVDSITSIEITKIADDLAEKSGFRNVEELLDPHGNELAVWSDTPVV